MASRRLAAGDRASSAQSSSLILLILKGKVILYPHQPRGWGGQNHRTENPLGGIQAVPLAGSPHRPAATRRIF